MVSFLFVLIAFQAMGWLLAWYLAQGYARYEAGRCIEQPAPPVLHLVCTAEQFQQSKVGRREVRFNGHLYDIKKVEQAGDSIRLVLYHDAREEQLFLVLGQLLHAKNALNAETPAPLIQWLLQWLTMVFVVPVAAYFRQKGFLFCFSPYFLYAFWLPPAPARRTFSPPWC